MHAVPDPNGHRAQDLLEVEACTGAVDQLRLAESAIARLANPSVRLTSPNASQLKMLEDLSALVLSSENGQRRQSPDCLSVT